MKCRNLKGVPLFTMEQTDIPIGENSPVFLQYAADNVDYNKVTISGEGTFHGMGIIVCVTPKVEYKCLIPRLKTVATEDLLRIAAIETNILPRRTSLKTLFTNLPKCSTHGNDALHNIWASTWLFKPETPLWNGYMQMVQKGEHPGAASILFMPMIDQKATDPMCVHSTMLFVCKQAIKYNAVPVLTFDQPLYWIAETIKASDQGKSVISNCLLRLGGFHMCMTFLAAVGHLMQGSGLKPVFELIYADNTVPKILDGKAYSRATRAHLLLYGTLIGIEIAGQMDYNLLDECEIPPELQQLLSLYNDLLSSKIALSEVDQTLAFTKILEIMKFMRTSENSLTSKLWCQYLDTIEIFCRFVEAERTGSWDQHLQATRDMLPYLASSGHYLYLKSAYLYLQTMHNLENTHPTVYQKFTEGLHVVRRSGRYWAGLSTDLVIEQVLMRSVKATGGMTRGGGMTEIQRAVWLLSTPVTSEINRAMQEFTRTTYETSEQHKESSDSRVERDHQDAKKLLEYLLERNPFASFDSLVNIHTGEVADSSVNVYHAKDIGEKIIESMNGLDVFSYSFKRKDMALTMKTKSTIRVEGETIHVDPMLLFQRLVLIMGKNPDKIDEVFSHELSTLPASLFDKDGLMREANKPALGNEISKIIGSTPQSISDETHYVIDGGYLIQRLPWKKGSTFLMICQSYLSYVKAHYDKNVTIVFDGYASSTKDSTHIRRAKGKVGKTIMLSLKNKLTVTKENFLVNKQNKESFIQMLGEEFKKSDYGVKYCEGDADLPIVLTALEIASQHKVTVIGDDTDLLVLLLYHKPITCKEVYLTSEAKANAKSQPIIWDIESVKQVLGKDVCNSLLTLHAVTGCDTTSRIHLIGKGAIVQKFISKQAFREVVEEFSKDEKTIQDVIKGGEKLLLQIMGAKSEKTLDELRLSKYYRKIAECKNALTPELLGPTSDAGRLHMMRVYHQVQTWKGQNNLILEEWGWKRTDTHILPILMTKPATLADLLKVFLCETGCTCHCRCVRNSIKCTASCKSCKGVSCCNSEDVSFD